MIHYMTQVGGGKYKIILETDVKEYYELVQDACREAVDRSRAAGAERDVERDDGEE